MGKARFVMMSPRVKGTKGALNRIQAPNGPLTLCAILREPKWGGHDVWFNDCALEGWENTRDISDRLLERGQTDEQIASYIDSIGPDIVGISVPFSNQYESMFDLARIVKSVSPKIKVVVGGGPITNGVEDFFFARRLFKEGTDDWDKYARLRYVDDPNIDFAIRGEADFTLPQFVDTIMRNGDVSKVPGILMRNQNGSREKYLISSMPEAPELDEIPPPARDIANMEKYFEIGAHHNPKGHSKRVLSLLGSRGCPKRCTYCATHKTFGTRVRVRPKENIREEVRKNVAKYNIGEIQISDDAPSAVRGYFYDLMDIVGETGLPACTPNGLNADYFMSEQLKMWKKAVACGFDQLTIAGESGCQRVLDELIQKKLKVEQTKQAVKNVKEAGAYCHAFVVLGHPSIDGFRAESKEERYQSIQGAFEWGADSYSVSMATPIAGTKLRFEVLKQKLLHPGFTIDDTIFTDSCFRVEGCDTREEFMEEVKEHTVFLKSRLKYGDYKRWNAYTGGVTSEKDKLHQS